MIDLRSDTVTLPPPEMRRAMYEAELGDDVYGEDPTINRLEERAAELLGKQAALFVTSGSQGNLVAVLTHATRGDEIVVGDQSHILHYEVGGASALAGVQVRTAPTQRDGTLPLSEIQAVLRDRTDFHNPYTRLICLENTHNRRGGVVLRPAYMRQVRELARENDVAVHLDGARLFNAAVALDVPVSALAADVDSVTFCASKGLAAPVGSLLCGSAAWIDQARRWRKMMGGGMRQAGIIAAGALYGLDHMVDRLAEDHALARRLAEGLAAIPAIDIDLESVETNIIVFSVARSGRSPMAIIEGLAARGVLISDFDRSLLRVVTHYGIAATHIEATLRAIQAVSREN
ncbi:MAG TPA: low-specificity L-threonine aldolase [Chloroflexota bacterium]|nr:low-specificity L-threonine aldolase [Chloroflexota bacterium]